eukprot:TRINITY_DN13271_c0_g1_i1.p1 TRINITY_DN13271_c0_g1~~TRINITY_DN13271_c0_g1_i1.p1  ORF type:complete len:262 (+),score=36.87 TRINITY_DN13271_c0_g1_i1:63-848(+)
MHQSEEQRRLIAAVEKYENYVKEKMESEYIPEIMRKKANELVETYFSSCRTLANEMDKPLRPCVIYLIGPTGSGKSSLINSLAQSKLANVGTTEPCSTKSETYDHPEINAIIVDTRGICEGQGLEVSKEHSAQEQLKQDVQKNKPDVILYLTTRSQHRVLGTRNVGFLKSLKESIQPPPPLLLVLTKMDDSIGDEIDPDDIEAIKNLGREDAKKIVEMYEKEGGLRFDTFCCCQTKIVFPERKGTQYQERSQYRRFEGDDH